jgi:hypothetical protein
MELPDVHFHLSVFVVVFCHTLPQSLLSGI